MQRPLAILFFTLCAATASAPSISSRSRPAATPGAEPGRIAPAEETVPPPGVPAAHLLERTTRELRGLVDRWSRLEGPARAAVEVELAAVASERRAHWRATVTERPAAAWDSLLGDSERWIVEELAPGNTAVPLQVEGRVLVAEDPGTGEPAYSLLERNGFRLELRSADRPLAVLRPGSTVALEGYLFDDVLLLGGAWTPTPVDDPTVLAGTSVVSPYLAVFGDFAGASYQGLGPAQVEELFTFDAKSVRNYYLENSYGELDIQTTVEPTVLFLGDVPDCTTLAGMHAEVLERAATALEALSVDLHQYEGLVLFLNLGGAGCPNGNSATQGPVRVDTASNSYMLTAAFLGNYTSKNYHVAYHEIGHSLGSAHAGHVVEFLSYSTAPITVCNYGDPLSPMGGQPESGACNVGISGTAHWSGPHKLEVGGWLDGGRTALLTGPVYDQDYTLYPLGVDVLDLDSPPANPLQLIKIPRNLGEALYVEYRRGIEGSLFETVAGLSKTGIVPSGSGMLYIQGGPARSDIIDPHADATHPPDWSSSALQVGQVYEDVCNGFTVEAASQGTNPPSMTFRVDYPITPCDDTPPSAQITTPTNQSMVSGTIWVKTLATDASGIGEVRYMVGDTVIGTSSTPPRFKVQWDTTQVANGLQTVQAFVTDDPADCCPDELAGCCPNLTEKSVEVFVLNEIPYPLTAPPTPVTQVHELAGDGTAALPLAVEARVPGGTGLELLELWVAPERAATAEALHAAGAWSERFEELGGDRAFLFGTGEGAARTFEVADLPAGAYRIWTRAYDVRGLHADSELARLRVR